MRSPVTAALDNRLQALVIARARREWPALNLVPARWMRPVVAPVADRLRRSLVRGTCAVSGAVAVVVLIT